MNEKAGNGFFKKMMAIDFMPLILAYAIIIVFFSVTSEYFLSLNNFLNIVLYAAVIGVLACTMTLIIVSGNIDLSIGSVIAFSNVIMGTMLQNGVHPALAIITALLAGVLTGIFNGVLIAYVKINAFITTLAGMQIFRGLSYIITDGKSLTVSDEFIKFVGRGYVGVVPVAAIIMVIFVIAFALIAKYTTFGRRIFVIGGNPQVAYLSGVNVKRSILGMFAINGLVCGVASLIYCSQIGAAMPQSATGMEFKVISAVILGGASLSGGKGSIVGAMFGALLLGTLDNGMVMLDIQTYWQQVIIGVVLVLAVLMDIIKNRRAQQFV